MLKVKDSGRLFPQKLLKRVLQENMQSKVWLSQDFISACNKLHTKIIKDIAKQADKIEGKHRLTQQDFEKVASKYLGVNEFMKHQKEIIGYMQSVKGSAEGLIKMLSEDGEGNDGK